MQFVRLNYVDVYFGSCHKSEQSVNWRLWCNLVPRAPSYLSLGNEVAYAGHREQCFLLY